MGAQSTGVCMVLDNNHTNYHIIMGTSLVVTPIKMMQHELLLVLQMYIHH